MDKNDHNGGDGESDCLSAARNGAPGWSLIALWLLGWCVLAIMAGLTSVYPCFPGDEWLTHRLQRIDSPVFVRALNLAENIADLPWALVIMLLVIGSLLALAKPSEALLLLLIGVWGRLFNAGLKELVEWSGSSLFQVNHNPSAFSFPSGHVTVAIVLYGFLIYLAAVTISSSLIRSFLQLACLCAIGFTALERVYIGAHRPSDVLGSILLGSLLVALFIWIHRYLLHQNFGLWCS